MQWASQYGICIAFFRAGGPRLRNVFASGVLNAAGWNSVIRVPQNATSRKSRFSGDSATPPTSAVVSSDNSGSLRAHSACAPGINHGMRNARNGHAVSRQPRTSGHRIQTDLAITLGAPRWGLAETQRAQTYDRERRVPFGTCSTRSIIEIDNTQRVETKP